MVNFNSFAILNKENLVIQKFSTHLSSSNTIKRNLENQVVILGV